MSSLVVFDDYVLSLVVFADKVVDFSIKFKVLLAILWFADGNLAGWGKDQKIAQPYTFGKISFC